MLEALAEARHAVLASRRSCAHAIQRAVGGPRDVQLAGLADLRVADVGRPDRGPWPLWFRYTLGGFVLAVLAFIRWRHRRRAG